MVNPSDVVFHVVHSREDASALFAICSSPFAFDAGAVLGLVPGPVLFAGESSGERLVYRFSAGRCSSFALRTSINTAKKVFAVPVVVFA